MRLVALRRGLDPLNFFRVTFGEGTAEHARTATQVEDTTWAQSGEGEVEVGILRLRVSEVVNLCDLSVLIVHTLVALPPRPPQPLLVDHSPKSSATLSST
jgi:hypothetical protein